MINLKDLKNFLYCFSVSMPTPDELRCFMFSVCPFGCPIIVKVIFQECLEGVSSNLAQMSTWTQGGTDSILVAKGQRSSSL